MLNTPGSPGLVSGVVQGDYELGAVGGPPGDANLLRIIIVIMLVRTVMGTRLVL